MDRASVYKSASAPELPNMILGTTYMLNRSCTKKIAVGLECDGNLFKPIVKFLTTSTPNKSVSLDLHSWCLFIQNSSDMDDYLKNPSSPYEDFDSEDIKKIVHLPEYDIVFSRSFSSRSIRLNKRDTEDNDNNNESDDYLAIKRRKIENLPSVVMQLPTYLGFKDAQPCIEKRLEELEKCQNMVNSAYECIVDFFIELAKKEKIIIYLQVSEAFKQFYATNKNEIEMFVNEKIKSTDFYNEYLCSLILTELYAFYLPCIAKDVLAKLQKKV